MPTFPLLVLTFAPTDGLPRRPSVPQPLKRMPPATLLPALPPALAAALPELAALLDLLRSDPAWRGDAAGVAALIMSVLRRVADAYAAASDAASAVVLLEAGLQL